MATPVVPHLPGVSAARRNAASVVHASSCVHEVAAHVTQHAMCEDGLMHADVGAALDSLLVRQFADAELDKAVDAPGTVKGLTNSQGIHFIDKRTIVLYGKINEEKMNKLTIGLQMIEYDFVERRDQYERWKRGEQLEMQPASKPVTPVVLGSVNQAESDTADIVDSLKGLLHGAQDVQPQWKAPTKQPKDPLEDGPLRLKICSSGGAVYPCLGAMDFLRFGMSLPVVTECFGKAFSAGACLFLCGDHRVIGPSSFVLLHEARYWAMGAHRDVQEETHNVEAAIKVIAGLILERTFANYEALKRDTRQPVPKVRLNHPRLQCARLFDVYKWGDDCYPEVNTTTISHIQMTTTVKEAKQVENVQTLPLPIAKEWLMVLKQCGLQHDHYNTAALDTLVANTSINTFHENWLKFMQWMLQTDYTLNACQCIRLGIATEQLGQSWFCNRFSLHNREEFLKQMVKLNLVRDHQRNTINRAKQQAKPKAGGE